MKKKLRLILGDQLNHNHPWFDDQNDSIIYLMAEMKQETSYVKHHIQKVVAFFCSMRNFAAWLEERGNKVLYFKIDDEQNPHQLDKLIKKQVTATNASIFEYQLPDEYRLDEQLRTICSSLEIETASIDTHHFFTTRNELSNFFKGKKQLLMESFYRMMRKKHEVMVIDGQPEGGKWNFDQSNRKKWKGSPEIPHERGFRKDVSTIVEAIKKMEITTFGSIDKTNFSWPTSREDCLSVLNYFCKNLLVHFGDYQDAMHTQEKFLFHSRLSFAMNSKMLAPKEVIDKVISFYYEHKEQVDISQVEGFVRQILGWREYMRGVYWKEMPAYANCNELDNHNPLPDFYWTGDTKMNCLHHSIRQSLEESYAHHIQRLMITGNYALLTQTNPAEVDVWYLGVYIDAIEWVEITNTRGMSQYADGGIVATKPYVSSGSYINKMSNYCSSCHYNVKDKTGDKACPFNSLYWHFLDDKRKQLENNPRMGMMYSLLNKMDPQKLADLKERANDVIENPQNF
ncbi:cryptochrome/photolyase family protein [Ascidiimonas sp. W6]|uniref:cryptochrome/photolyase family protein n=1 Tax=Ascidiimonas meishanensis TaxID=3128903 RepID=UPI0030ECB40D